MWPVPWKSEEGWVVLVRCLLPSRIKRRLVLRRHAYGVYPLFTWFITLPHALPLQPLGL